MYYGTRDVQKTHVARLKFPAPATMETWVTDQDGDPVFMIIAEPSDSLAGELRRLLPDLRGIVGQGRRVTVCFDRGGWSPALFADITAAGFDLLTWRKGPAPDLPAEEFTTITCTDDRDRRHEYDLADTTAELAVNEGPRKGQTVSLRQVTLWPGIEDADDPDIGDADDRKRQRPAGWCGGALRWVRCRWWSVWWRRQSTTSVTAERVAASSTRFLPAAKAATRDCRARLLTARG